MKKRIVFYGILVFICLILVIIIKYLLTLPQIPDDLNKIALTQPTKIYDDNNQVIKVLANRQVVPIDFISPDLVNAFIALEDKNFYKHHGISKFSIINALFYNLKSGRIRGGGSTITQQLVKNLFFDFHKSWSRKIKEALLTFQIERQFAKKDILEAYLNQIDFGSGVYGVELAAQTYFSKHADELTVEESAMLAGIPRWPARYSPYKNKEIAKERYMFVIKRMADEGFITQDKRQELSARELEYHRMNVFSGSADYFLDYILKTASEDLGRGAVNYGGLDIFTTMNSHYQFEATRAVKEKLAEFDLLMGFPPYEQASWEEKLNYPQAALVAIDVHSGDVKAMVGGRDFIRSPFNRAVSNNRSPGSAFKLFIYFGALDKGIITPSTVLIDQPVKIEFDNQVWEPENFEKEYLGPMTVKYGLSESRNTIAAQIIQRLTPEVAVEYAQKMGIKSPLQPLYSLALGATSVSPYEMASAYVTIASEGIRKEPKMIKAIKSAENKNLWSKSYKNEKLFDAQTCYIMIDMLRGVVEHGTAKSIKTLKFRRPCAGKTGTSGDNRDAWFIGFTPDLVTVVWVGFDDNRMMHDKWGGSITGGRAAIPIWVEFMKSALGNSLFTDFKRPPGIIFKEIDPRTGAGPMPGEPKITIAERMEY